MSQERVADLVDKIGAERTASVLGVRTRQVERWVSGTGFTNRADSQRIARASSKADALAIIADAGGRNERQVRRGMRTIAEAKSNQSKQSRAITMAILRDAIDFDSIADDADVYGSVYGGA